MVLLLLRLRITSYRVKPEHKLSLLDLVLA